LKDLVLIRGRVLFTEGNSVRVEASVMGAAVLWAPWF